MTAEAGGRPDGSAQPLDFIFLHSISEQLATGPKPDLDTVRTMTTYSSYKHGSPYAVDEFAGEFVDVINDQLPVADASEDWVVITPPFSFDGLPSSVVAVGEKVADELGVQYVRAYTDGHDELRVGRYTSLSTPEDRLADRRRKAIRFVMEDGGDLEGKRVILIDDIHVTGATAENLNGVLKEERVLDVSAFAIVHLDSDSPTFEEAVNTAMLDDLPTFLRGLNHPEMVMNRRTFKTIYLMEPERFETVITGLSRETLSKVIDAGGLYIHGDRDPSRLEFMKSLAGLHEQYTKPLTPEEQELTDKDIRTLGLAGQAVEHELGGRMILSGGYVAEALGGGNVTRFHDDMDTRIFLPYGTDVDEALRQLMPALQSGGYETWEQTKRVGNKFQFFEKVDSPDQTPRQLEINFEVLTEQQPDDPNVVRVKGSDGAPDYDIELAQATLIDSEGKAVQVESRSMDEAVARRALRLTAKHIGRLRDVKWTDIRDLQRLISTQEFNEETCTDFIATYLHDTQGTDPEEARVQAADEMTRVRQIISHFFVSNLALS